MRPQLLPEILSVLFQVKLCKCAILGDVSKASLQFTLDLEDRDLTRFLWYRLYETIGVGIIYYELSYYVQFHQNAFRAHCSHFLLSATIRTLVTINHDTCPTAYVQKHLYVCFRCLRNT